MLSFEVIDKEMAEVLRRKTPAERFAIANCLMRSLRSMLAVHLAEQHPDWTADEVRREVGRRCLHGTQ